MIKREKEYYPFDQEHSPLYFPTKKKKKEYSPLKKKIQRRFGMIRNT